MSVQLSVVIPCYNEIEGIAALRERVTAACEAHARGAWEVILIDDGSKDGTTQAIREIAADDPRYGGLILSRNYGHQIALTAGLHYAQGDRILILDADLQDPPELLGDMMALMDNGADVVYGKRLSRAGETAFKTASAALFYRFLNRLSEVPIPEDTGDFRLMSRRALDVLNAMPEQHRFIRGMVSWIGYRQVPLEYHRDERFAGETKYPLRKMLRLTVDALTSFSIVPLRLASWVGMITAALSVPLLIYVIISWLAGGTVQGWVSLTGIVVLFGGIQLIVVGIIGEYVGRMYMQSKNRPLFLVDSFERQGGVAAQPISDPAVASQARSNSSRHA
ncbi:glycosyltransferase family 2 protein [Gymnodinialimonas sp. 2305UL16-5]|uniref:glycosyltransferase family 2 protein n=1 Tax=Gymnodinialimonas mytili TaxID=3126503 RepID=UPI0030AA6D93